MYFLHSHPHGGRGGGRLMSSSTSSMSVENKLSFPSAHHAFVVAGRSIVGLHESNDQPLFLSKDDNENHGFFVYYGSAAFGEIVKSRTYIH
jgi:hypothetical protein